MRARPRLVSALRAINAIESRASEPSDTEVCPATTSGPADEREHPPVLGADQHVGLGVAAVDRDDTACRSSGPRQVVAPAAISSSVEPLGEVVLADQRVREQRPVDPVAATAERGVERQLLVRADVRDEPGHERIERPGRNRARAGGVDPCRSPRSPRRRPGTAACRRCVRSPSAARRRRSAARRPGRWRPPSRTRRRAGRAGPAWCRAPGRGTSRAACASISATASPRVGAPISSCERPRRGRSSSAGSRTARSRSASSTARRQLRPRRRDLRQRVGQQLGQPVDAVDVRGPLPGQVVESDVVEHHRGRFDAEPCRRTAAGIRSRRCTGRRRGGRRRAGHG